MMPSRASSPLHGQRRDRFPLFAVLVAAAAAPLGLAGGGPAPTVDLELSRIEVNQAIQDGFTPLIAGRPCFVRAAAKVSGASGPVQFDGLMRVYVGGQEIPGSPIFSDNGPILAKQPVDWNKEHDTLNFVFLPPASAGVVIEVEINPSGPNHVPETNPNNNWKASPPLSFECRRVPELAFVPIDYRPSGGPIPNLPDPLLLEPGMGDNFMHGIYPVRDFDYHRSDAPSKLWTQSLAGSGSSLLAALDVDLALMNPKPDLLYGFVPGGLPYNGQSMINGKVAMGNTESLRYQRTLAHEVGHNFGLNHNSLTVGFFGVDVEDHLWLPLSLASIKSNTLKDIMYGGLLTPEAWIAPTVYAYLCAHPWLACGADQDKSASVETAAPVLMIAGTCDRATGAIEIADALSFAGGEPTPGVARGAADLVVRTYAGGELAGEVFVAASSTADECGTAHDSATVTDPRAAFSALLPVASANGAPVERVEVVHLDSGASRSLAISATAPDAMFRAIEATADGKLRVAWSASDPDGDPLRVYLRFSPGGTRWAPLATGLDGDVSEVVFDRSEIPAAGAGVFELLASDGLRTSVARSTLAASAIPAKGAASSVPWVHILSPDLAAASLKGAPLVLHGSGFDLEDRMLDGTSLEWWSSLDGYLGHGRLEAIADLSVGSHVITLLARDSTAVTATDTATLTVVDRGLPDVGPVCQHDLGFDGPGASVLKICGGDLSAGTTATLELTGAPPSQTVYFLASTSLNPTPMLGGMLVPLPASMLMGASADASGSIAVNGILGGGGPVTVFLQAVCIDPQQPLGFGISNALQVDMLP